MRGCLSCSLDPGRRDHPIVDGLACGMSCNICFIGYLNLRRSELKNIKGHY